MIDTAFLKSGHYWGSTDLAAMQFSLLTSVPSYYLVPPIALAHATLFNPDTEFAFTIDTNSSNFDQEDVARFLLLDPLALTGFAGTNTINDRFVDTVDYAVSGDNYRVSFADVIGINLTEATPGVGQITFVNQDRYTSSQDSIAYLPTGLNQTSGVAGDIFINGLDTDKQTYLAPGEEGFWVILHELGHAIGGLNDYSGGTYDSQKYSMMSYNTYGVPHSSTGDVVYASGLQLLDIAALQETYGSWNFATRTGNTEYSLGKDLGFAGATADDPFLYTIWDGGGDDTIDASLFNVGAEIDLRQGRFSSIGKDASGGAWAIDAAAHPTNDPDPGNVAIAYGTIIENAIGTSSVDFLIGNAWSNTLTGGAGNDQFWGDGYIYDGDTARQIFFDQPTADNDIMLGGTGDDTFHLWSGVKDPVEIEFGGGYDYVDGGDDDDTVWLLLADDTAVQVGGTHNLLKSWHHVVDVETISLSHDVETHFMIHQVGVAYQNYSTITLDYSAQGTALTANLSAPTITVGTETDSFTNEAYIVGTNHGDTFNGTHAEVDRIYAGGGDDSVTMKFGLTVFYSDGDDTVYAGDLGTVILPVGVDASALSYSVVNLTGPVSTYDDEGWDTSTWTGDIQIEIDGLGSILFKEQYTHTTRRAGSDLYSGDVAVVLQTAAGNRTYSVFADGPPGASALDHTASTPAAGIVHGKWTADSFSFVTFSNAYAFYANGGDDTITTRLDNLTIDGGSGTDTLVIAGSLFDWEADWNIGNYLEITDGSVEYEAHSIEFFQFSDHLVSAHNLRNAYSGTSGNDTYEGSNLVEYVFGAGGQDWFQGGGGNDKLFGGDGDDILEGDNDDDLLDGGSGSDQLYGDNGNDTLYGGAGSDLLQGLEGHDLLYGDGDGDTLQGGEGNDTLYGGTGADAMYGDAGTDALYGEDGGDGLFGGDGNDLLVGGAGDDDLFGGNNNDVLVGGAGYDYLYGNAGADIFFFQDVEIGTTHDTVWDFNLSHGDKIDFSELLTAYDPLTDAIADFVGIAIVSGDTLIGVDKDGTGSAHAFELVAVLDNVIPPSTNPRRDLALRSMQGSAPAPVALPGQSGQTNRPSLFHAG